MQIKAMELSCTIAKDRAQKDVFLSTEVTSAESTLKYHWMQKLGERENWGKSGDLCQPDGKPPIRRNYGWTALAEKMSKEHTKASTRENMPQFRSFIYGLKFPH